MFTPHSGAVGMGAGIYFDTETTIAFSYGDHQHMPQLTSRRQGGVPNNTVIALLNLFE